MHRAAVGAPLGAAMMRGLLRKELRAQRPFLVLVFALELMHLFTVLTIPSELKSLGQTFDSVTWLDAFIGLLLAFAIGSGLLVREIDDGTLAFLDGLPLTRRDVYLAKFSAAMVVTAVPGVLGTLIVVATHLVTRDSLDYQIHPGLLWTNLWLTILLNALGVTLGMLLGFLRHLAWIVFAMAVVAVALIKKAAPDLGAALDPTELTLPHFVGASWRLPAATLWTQLGAAILCGLLALALFNAAGTLLPRWRAWRASRTLSARLGVPLLWILIGGATTAGAVYLFGTYAQKGAGAGDEAVAFAHSADGHAATTHYTFTYQAVNSARVNELIDGADDTFLSVAKLLGVEPGGPVDVDLSGSIDNTAGTAYFDRIRMDLVKIDSLDVLAHETTHVFARRLAGGENARELDGMTVFNEGLAHWVEGKLARDAEQQAQFASKEELVEAIISSRHQVAPRDLTSYANLMAKVDGDLKYPLGALVVDRLVRRYGAAAPATLLRTLGRADFPRELEGYALWQTAFQLSGFDLDLVFDDYARRLKELERAHAAWIATLPRLRGSLVRVGSLETLVGVKVRWEGTLPKGGKLVVRFRPDSASALDQYHTSFPLGANIAVISTSQTAHGEVCFQPGFTLGWGTAAVYEPWRCLPIDSARRVKSLTDESD
ncbi:MAG: ABC transporter permease subunit [Massilia sp.]